MPSPPAGPVIIAVGMPVTLPTCESCSTSHDGPMPRSQLRSHSARGPRRVPAARQRPGRDDHRGAAAVPAHVELGRRLRVDRPRPAERRAGRRRTRHAAVGAVGQRHDPAHRLRQRRRRLLPRTGPVGDLRAGRQRAAVAAHLGHHPAAGARDRRAAHPRPRPHRGADPPARWPRRSSTAAGTTWCAGTAGWPKPATQRGTAASRSITAGSPAWTTRRGGMPRTPT